MIRRAEPRDLTMAMLLSKRCYDEMGFDSFGYHFDHDHILSNYRLAISTPEKFIFLVSETHGDIDGIIFCAMVDTTLYFKGQRFAQEVVWHSDPNISSFSRGKVMISLLKAAESEMTRRGGMPFYLSSDVRQKFENVGSYLEKQGYREMCRYFYKGVTHGNP